LTTPLQVNVWTQVVANGGTLYQPHLLESKSKEQRANLISDKNISLIRQGMTESCSKGGVAYPLFEFKVPSYAKASEGKQNERFKIDGKNFIDVPASESAKKMVQISVACKTGTAQHGGDETLPHAWITLFAPVYKPEVVVTVLAESSGEGSNIAAPIAKKVLEAYFGKL
jgi:penicillin-binding protein 2